MLWLDFHLGEETIDEIGRVEEDVIRQIIPDFEAAEDVCCSVTCSNSDFTILNEASRKRETKCHIESAVERKLISLCKLTFDWRGKNKLGWYFGSNANDSDSWVNMSCTLTSSPKTSMGCCWLLLEFLKSELIWDAWSTASGVPAGRPCCWFVMSISDWVSILLQLLLTVNFPTTLSSLLSSVWWW